MLLPCASFSKEPVRREGTFISLNEHIDIRVEEIKVSADKELKTYVIPIKRANNLILVEGAVDSISGNFVLDTGAPYLVLNQTYFRDYRNLGYTEAGGINGSAPGFKTWVKAFSTNGFNQNRLSADVTNLGHIETAKNIKILGLLGTGLFERTAMVVDLYKGKLFIHELDRKGQIPADQVLYSKPYLSMKFALKEQVIVLQAEAAGKSLNFAFDTGAETNVIDYGLSKKLLENFKEISRLSMGGMGAGRNEVIYARLDSMKLGERTFMNNRFLIANMSKMNRFYQLNLQGMLGHDFFCRGVFMLNFATNEFNLYIRDTGGTI